MKLACVALALAVVLPAVAAFSGFEHAKNGDLAFEAAIKAKLFAKLGTPAHRPPTGLSKDSFAPVRALFGMMLPGKPTPSLVEVANVNVEQFLTYGHIVALAGDFYGHPTYKPLCSFPPDRRAEAFELAFKSLYHDRRRAAPKLVKALAEELKNYQTGKKENQILETLFFGRVTQSSPATSVKAMWESMKRSFTSMFTSESEESLAVDPEAGEDLSLKMHELDDSPYLLLLNNNNDHFPAGNAKCGEMAYRAGHEFAQKNARDGTLACAAKPAPKQGPCLLKVLTESLAMNAFADHYLSDMFSSGHMRTPCVELRKKCGGKAGGLYANVMHDEDGHKGVLVTVPGGSASFMAYGDGSFLTTKNAKGREAAIAALLKSLTEVVEAMMNPTDTTAKFGALKMRMEPVTGAGARPAPPLFSLEGDKVIARTAKCEAGRAVFGTEDFDCGGINTLSAAYMKFGSMSDHSPTPCSEERLRFMERQRMKGAGLHLRKGGDQLRLAP